MQRIITMVILSSLIFIGCAPTIINTDLYLMGKGNAPSGTGISYQNGKAIIYLGGSEYKGTWVHVQDFSMVSTEFSGLMGSFGNIGVQGFGTNRSNVNSNTVCGTMLLTNDRGGRLHCLYRAGLGMGMGVCIDDNNKQYDIQLRDQIK